jgi:hypothetical protein
MLFPSFNLNRINVLATISFERYRFPTKELLKLNASRHLAHSDVTQNLS